MTNFKEVLLLALAEPEYSRTEFWSSIQKESNFSENVFWRKLNDCWQFYFNKISTEISVKNSFGSNVTDFAIPLLFETSQKMTGHLGLEQLRTLYSVLIDYGREKSLMQFFYNYDLSTIQVSLSTAPAKNFDVLKLLNENMFKGDFAKKQPTEIPEFLNNHLKHYLREGGNKAEWIKHTKQFISQLSIEQQDSFYNWIDANSNEFEPKQIETKIEHETENDFTLSTIEDWLFEFKEKMNQTDYQNLVSALLNYFKTGKFPILSKPIQINGRPNKKLVGWALNRIFEAKGKGVEKELLQFAKDNISIFSNVQFDEKNILNSNLYKYFTTQTK